MSTVNVSVVPTEKPTVWSNTTGYSVGEILIPGAVTPVAGGAGDSVTVTFNIGFESENPEFPETLPSIYNIQATPSQACSVHYVKTSQLAFNIVLTPLDAGVTLAAGTVDVVVSFSRG